MDLTGVIYDATVWWGDIPHGGYHTIKEIWVGWEDDVSPSSAKGVCFNYDEDKLNVFTHDTPRNVFDSQHSRYWGRHTPEVKDGASPLTPITISRTLYDNLKQIVELQDHVKALKSKASIEVMTLFG